MFAKVVAWKFEAVVGRSGGGQHGAAPTRPRSPKDPVAPKLKRATELTSGGTDIPWAENLGFSTPLPNQAPADRHLVRAWVGWPIFLGSRTWTSGL